MEKRIFEIVLPQNVLALIPNDETHYVLGHEFLKKMEDVSETENRIATKYLKIMDLSLEDDDNSLLILSPQELHNLLIFIQRETLKLSQP